ncbi:cyanophycin synthetase [Legionella beliardensis]|uniref:Cyanophycin synthetase n=1 Tax=Legionella beliardensis TaxID=91822 RepID=A0A378I2W1_9GAMM|nr:cyanophycin synthetase [Legionella beliardensis]STX29045.1 cyanophycin synthetase [Legionella beliardensis]
MKIISTRVLNGPNYWSNFRQKLIEIRLDLESYEYSPSNILEGFNTRLKELIPSLYNHYCSPGIEGGFYIRLEEGTWLGHVMEHVALELQNLAGLDCGFGRTFGTDTEGVYDVIFTYEIEKAGLYAGNAAFNIIQSLAQGKNYLNFEQDITELKHIIAHEKIGPSTEAILKEAKKRNIPISPFKDTSLITLGYGVYQKRVWATISSQTSSIGVDIATHKDMTKQLLAANAIPVPDGITIRSLDQLDDAIDLLNFPLVIKPLNGNHGRGIITNIQTKEKAILAFNLAQKVSKDIIVEQFIEGNDYRFLVINYKLIAVAKRTPAKITGDGIKTIQQLIDEVNDDPKRGLAHENCLTTIKVDEETHSILAEKKLTLHSVLKAGEHLYLKCTANLSSGGTATNITNQVHPENIALAERVARLIQLDVCGIDVVCKSVRVPLAKQRGAVIEVNASPGFRMHTAPNEGAPINVGAPFIDMLFPPGKPSRIPIIAVTGTNGKTTVVRLIARFAKQANHYVGFTTTEGIYLNNKLIYRGDCSGPLSARTVLMEPLVDFAVLECARGGIIRSGLGFDQCDISIITNITTDHLGIDGINTIEKLVDVKSVVARSTHKNGYALLNADNKLVYDLKNELVCNIALFALTKNARIKQHCQAGGLAAFIEDDMVIVQKGIEKQAIAKIKDIPLTFKGSATFMVNNILPAVLAGIIQGFSAKLMAQSLYDFQPTVENTPGRMNMFNFDHCQVIIDYAHNEDAYIQLKKFLDTMEYAKKVGIIAASGDRREEDIQRLGYYAAQMFDEIIIRHNKNGRGRTNQQLTDLITTGIHSADPKVKIKVISEEFEALEYAIEHAERNSLIYCSVDDVFDSVEFMLEQKHIQPVKQINETIFL